MLFTRIYFISFDLQKSKGQSVIIFIYKREEGNSKRLSTLSNITQLVKAYSKIKGNSAEISFYKNINKRCVRKMQERIENENIKTFECVMSAVFT